MLYDAFVHEDGSADTLSPAQFPGVAVFDLLLRSPREILVVTILRNGF